MTNTSDSDPKFNIPFASCNVILPSYNQAPKKKRNKTSNNETGGASSSSSNPKPVKKPNHNNAPKITSPCTECGKQFWSSKALYGHMRCHPERPWRGIKPPPNYKRVTTTTTTTATSSSSLWVSVTSEEDHNMAYCLLMLANGSSTRSSGVVEGWFECSGRCKKVFGSHQALGRNRDTHKHVKGSFSITNLSEDPSPPPREIVVQDNKRKSVKLVLGTNHRCNICFKVFTSGQALGGHMRRHLERDQDSTAIDLNIPATTVQNLSCSSSDTLSECSLDLRLGL